MCGIAGLYEDAGVARHHDVVERMIASLHHRGPDDRGRHTSGKLSMGMTRLAIIDVAGGGQPLSNEDGTITVVCNGEIYNHAELRTELSGRGHVFRTGSDVEVIAHLYEEAGDACVARLRGMFALALWDEPRQRLLLARDRLGIKPLFYAFRGGRLVFGSELKAIARSGLVPLELDDRSLRQYLSYGYVPAPRTIYRGIRKLEPGHVLTCENGELLTQRYWRMRFDPAAEADEATLGRRFLELFSDAVRSHLMSDVSLGAFLSGGVDSSLVVALMSECASGPVKTFTIGFGGGIGGYLDERSYARQVSRQYGTEHSEFEVQPDLEQTLDEVVDAFDEPFADDSVIPTYHICKLARAHVTVALTGLGGDELFGGYERYLGLTLSRRYNRLPRLLRRGLIAPLVRRLPERRDGHYTINHLKRFVRSADLPDTRRYLDYLTIFNDELKARLFRPDAWPAPEARDPLQEDDHDEGRHFDSDNAHDLLDRALYHDAQTYLPEDILALSDRLSMRCGLELRVPFLDHPLVEFCAGIPPTLKVRALAKKYLLKSVARPFLPAAVLHHRKQGFGSPMAAWLRADLKPYLLETLSTKRLARHGLFDPAAVRSLIDAHLSLAESHDRQLFALIMFQKWHERFA
jgi:asparagine synthase (glutamine-hydrolysing)